MCSALTGRQKSSWRRFLFLPLAVKDLMCGSDVWSSSLLVGSSNRQIFTQTRYIKTPVSNRASKVCQLILMTERIIVLSFMFRWMLMFSSTVCHAELNAIMNKNSADVKGCTMYVALFPCNECAKLIIQAGLYRRHFRALSSSLIKQPRCPFCILGCVNVNLFNLERKKH